jgi:hypothetical protein
MAGDESGWLKCQRCDEPIDPAQYRKYPDCPPFLHIECAIRMSVGSEGHQTYRCPCYGGTYEDPPGVSIRDAARAAFRVWEGRHGHN